MDGCTVTHTRSHRQTDRQTDRQQLMYAHGGGVPRSQRSKALGLLINTVVPRCVCVCVCDGAAGCCGGDVTLRGGGPLRVPPPPLLFAVGGGLLFIVVPRRHTNSHTSAQGLLKFSWSAACRILTHTHTHTQRFAIPACSPGFFSAGVLPDSL